MGSFFYSSYGEFAQRALLEVRREAYGEDIGQFSWITADELNGFLQQLEVNTTSHLLDVACGSGGPALFMAHNIGCRVTGIDINESGIKTANLAAAKEGLHDRVDALPR